MMMSDSRPEPASYVAREAAFTVPSTLYRITGMDCAEEVTVLQRELGPLVGGAEHLGFDILNGRMRLLPSASHPGDEVLLEAIAETGMQGEVWRDASTFTAKEPVSRGLSYRRLATLMSGVAIVTAVAVHGLMAGNWQAGLGVIESPMPWPVRMLYLLGTVFGAWFVAPKAYHALRRLRPDMNLLMVVAVSGAFAVDEWFEAAAVAFLFSLSLLLENWSVRRARRAVEALLDLSPPTVRLRTQDGRENVVSPEDTQVGAVFVVKPGERIALDGEIVDGRTVVNQAPITGESAPVAKHSGDAVFAGTVNGDGAIIVRSTKPAGETTLAHIIRMVGDARSRKSPSERWVEQFARVYTPIVVVLAILVATIPPVLLSQPWNRWGYSALVLLLIACPCALVISTPVTIVSALAAAARQGVLIKGGEFIEAPARLKAIAFDKTGTLTEGKPRVVEIVPLSGHTDHELLERALALEMLSEHPLAQAIVRHAKSLGVVPIAAEDVQMVPGKGVSGRFDGRLFWLGSHRFLEERGLEVPEIRAQLNELMSSGRSVIVVGNDDHVCGLIALADDVRIAASVTLHCLRNQGVKHLVMLTGDNAATAAEISKRVGIDEFYSELLPNDKVLAIEQLVQRYQSVAMIGDGVNDAPALARASIGIAMGATGTDVAIETADIALMTDDLSRLPWLIGHSRRALTIVRQNIAFALAVKLLFVGLTFAGMASLWSAIAADTGASLLVIFNGLRLLRA